MKNKMKIKENKIKLVNVCRNYSKINRGSFLDSTVYPSRLQLTCKKDCDHYYKSYVEL